MRTPAFLIGKAAENPLWGEKNAVWEEAHAPCLGTWAPVTTGLYRPNGGTPGVGPMPGPWTLRVPWPWTEIKKCLFFFGPGRQWEFSAHSFSQFHFTEKLPVSLFFCFAPISVTHAVTWGKIHTSQAALVLPVAVLSPCTPALPRLLG